MEKVKIKSVKDSGKKTKDGYPIFSVELNDGRKCSAFTEDAAKWTGEMELIVKPGQLYNGVQYYNLFTKENTVKKSNSGKDYSFEKRNASLAHAINTASLAEKPVKANDILIVAEKYYEYLNKKD